MRSPLVQPLPRCWVLSFLTGYALSSCPTFTPRLGSQLSDGVCSIFLSIFYWCSVAGVPHDTDPRRWWSIDRMPNASFQRRRWQVSEPARAMARHHVAKTRPSHEPRQRRPLQSNVGPHSATLFDVNMMSNEWLYSMVLYSGTYIDHTSSLGAYEPQIFWTPYNATCLPYLISFSHTMAARSISC